MQRQLLLVIFIPVKICLDTLRKGNYIVYTLGSLVSGVR